MDKIEKANFSFEDIAYFWMHVKKSTKSCKFTDRFGKCWEWTGPFFSSGYGHFVNHCISYRAHRVSYYIYNGNISKDMFICHKCDNPKCVNPKHLFMGTAKDNVKDRDTKERHKPAGKHKLNSSKYYGVYCRSDKKTKKWRVRICHKYKEIHVGCYDSETEAAKAYDEKIKILKLDKPLNFQND